MIVCTDYTPLTPIPLYSMPGFPEVNIHIHILALISLCYQRFMSSFRESPPPPPLPKKKDIKPPQDSRVAVHLLTHIPPTQLRCSDVEPISSPFTPYCRGGGTLLSVTQQQKLVSEH